MCTLRIHFLDNTAGHDASLAATILSHTLKHQGLGGQLESDSIVVANDVESPCDEIYFLLDDNLTTATHFTDGCAVVVSSARPARTLCAELGGHNLTAVDAAGIGADEGADPAIALLGAATRVLPFLDVELLCSAIWAVYDQHLPYAAHAAMRAFDLGISQAQQVTGQGA